MKRENKSVFFLLLGIILIYSCSKDNESYQYDYPYVILSNLSNLNEEGVTATGEIKNLGRDSIIDYGFVWCANDTPTIFNYKLSIAGKPEIGIFRGRLNNCITSNVLYNVRPFIQGKKYLVYGNIMQFEGLGSLTPKITDFEPKEGKRKSQVTITGENFNSNPEVYFGTEKAKVIKANSTEIIVEVPPGIGNVKISLHQDVVIVSNQTYNILYPWTNIPLPDTLLSVEYPCCFSVNGKGYFFGGYSVATNSYTKNLWEYNPLSNGWILKADFPGEARRFAICMIINNKAYVGLGDNGTFSAGFSDFWEYDPSSDTWTRKADFPLSKYGIPTSSSANNKGFTGLGLEQFQPGAGGQLSSKFWSFDPIINSWEQIADYPVKSFLATTFGVDGSLYAGLGSGMDSYSDIYEFDPLTNSWSNKLTYPGKGRWNVKNFVIGDMVYIGFGNLNNGNYFTDFWAFNTVNKTWAEQIEFPYSTEVLAGFSINNKGYIYETINESSTSKRSFWQFDPEKNY